MKQIIIDTNALMTISETGIALFEEIHNICNFPYSLHILEGTKKELEKIKETQRGKYSTAAKLALSILEKKQIDIIPETGFVDDLLVKRSKKGDIILTSDKELKERLTKPFITVRQGKRLLLVQ